MIKSFKKIVSFRLLLCGMVTFVGMSQIKAQTTYYWVGGTTAANFNAANVWATSLGGAAAVPIVSSANIFIIDGSNVGSIASPQTGNVTINMTGATSVGQLILQNAASVTLTGTTSARVLTIGGTIAGADFSISNNSSLTLSTLANITIASGSTSGIAGTLTIAASRIFTTDAALVSSSVTGSIINSGTVTSLSTTLSFTGNGTYEHRQNGGTIPLAAWAASSTCYVTGMTSTAPTITAQTYGNFIWECNGQGNVQAVANSNSFSIQSGSTFTCRNTGSSGGSFNIAGTGTASTVSQTWAGDLNITGGTFNIVRHAGGASVNGILAVNKLSVSGGTLNLNNNTLLGGGPDASLTVNDSLNLSGGTIDLDATTNTSTNQFTNLYLNGHFRWSGGTLRRSNSADPGPYTTIDFTRASGTQTFTQTLGSITYSSVGRGITWDESGGSNLNITCIGTTGTIVGFKTGVTPSISGNLTINCSSSASLGASASSVAGIVYMTQGTLSGSFAIVSGVVQIGSLIYNGTAAQTVGDTEWPSSLTKNVSIENTSAAGVTLNADKTGYNSSGTITVKNGSRFNFSTFFIGGTGAFTLEAGGTIASANSEGFGNGSTIGSIRVSGTKTLNNGANYIFNGAVQNSGTIIMPTGAGTVNNLTIAASGRVTLSQPTTVTGTITLSSGLLVTTSTNLLTVTNTLPSAITGGSASRYITGPVQWNIGVGDYVFPVGKNAGTNPGYYPFTLSTTAANNPVITVEAFNTNVGAPTFNSPLTGASNTEHWLAVLNSGTFEGSVSLTRQLALTISENTIAQSAAASGTYSSIGGTDNTPSINNSSPITSLGYFVIGKTSCLEPTAQASGISFSSVTTSGITVNWTSNGTGSDGVILVVKAGSAPSDPLDNTNYSASANFNTPGSDVNNDNSYVAYIGNGSSVTLSNLTPATNYYFKLYAKNCMGANIDILINSPATGNQFTLSLEPTAQPGSFTAASSACSQITLTFPAASTITNAAGYLIIQRTSAAPTGTPSDANGYSVGASIGDGQVAALVASATATTVNINGLATSGAQYHFSIIPFGYNGTNAPTFNYFIGSTIRTASSTISCARYYVNDNVTTGDVYCTAIGNDVNNGTAPETPKATVTDILNDYKLTGKDTVYIDHGSYTESFVIDGKNANANLNDEGSLITATPFAANYLVFKGAGSTKTTFTSTSQLYNIFIRRAKYVSIEGINFINISTTNSISNIDKEHGGSTIIKNCRLEINNTSSNAAHKSYNISFQCFYNTLLNVQNSLIQSNTIINNNPNGIGMNLVGDVDNSRFERNSITMTGENGKGMLFLRVGPLSDEPGGIGNFWPVSDTISKNTIISNHNGIELYSDDSDQEFEDYLITGNKITINNATSPRSSIFLFNAGLDSDDDIKIFKNTLSGGYSGIYIFDRGEYLKIHNNYICSQFGVYSRTYIGDGTDKENEFLHNSLYTSGSCLYFSGSSQDDWDIRNNILYTTASSPSACIEVTSYPNSGYNVESINGNLFYRTGSAHIGVINSSTYSTLPLWQAQDIANNSTNDPSSLEGIAPNYEAPANCDLDLLPDITNWTSSYPNAGLNSWAGNASFTFGTTGLVSTDIRDIPNRAFFTIGAFEANSSTILPVQLLAFNARLNAQRVLLDWQTATEVNSSYFDVEKSKDGVSGWSFVARVQSRGNSSVRADYTSIDHKPYGGESYYRLKQVDQDGRIAYSQTRKINNEIKTISVYPNPASDHAVIEGLDKNRSNMIHLLDITGKLLSERFVKDSQYRIDLSKLQPGVYHVMINGTEHFQLVKKQ